MIGVGIIEKKKIGLSVKALLFDVPLYAGGGTYINESLSPVQGEWISVI